MKINIFFNYNYSLSKMSILEYHKYTQDQLQDTDLVKISINYKNAYDHQNKIYVGPLTEHIWCKIIDILDNNVLSVLVSNNCFYSENRDTEPLIYNNIIEINCINIQTHKRYTQTSYDKTVHNFSEILSNIPEKIMLHINSLEKREAIVFLEEYLFKPTYQDPISNTH